MDARPSQEDDEALRALHAQVDALLSSAGSGAEPGNVAAPATATDAAASNLPPPRAAQLQYAAGPHELLAAALAAASASCLSQVPPLPGDERPLPLLLPGLPLPLPQMPTATGAPCVPTAALDPPTQRQQAEMRAAEVHNPVSVAAGAAPAASASRTAAPSHPPPPRLHAASQRPPLPPQEGRAPVGAAPAVAGAAAPAAQPHPAAQQQVGGVQGGGGAVAKGAAPSPPGAPRERTTRGGDGAAAAGAAGRGGSGNGAEADVKAEWRQRAAVLADALERMGTHPLHLGLELRVQVSAAISLVQRSLTPATDPLVLAARFKLAFLATAELARRRATHGQAPPEVVDTLALMRQAYVQAKCEAEAAVVILQQRRRQQREWPPTPDRFTEE